MKMKKIYRDYLRIASVFLLLLWTTSAYAQSKVVTGTITDESGSPMPGVNVVIKGTTIGTTTGANGSYTIEANSDAIIGVSFIGYVTQEVRVGDRSVINFTLVEDVATLQEVVVVGYGEMRRNDITAAQTAISSKDIERTINTTIEQAIQGRSAGVFVTQNTGAPGGGISVNIRGVNSISGTK